MGKSLLLGVTVILVIPFIPLMDYACYRDKKPFLPPVSYADEVPIRNDNYGDGSFGASRSGGRSHKGLDINSPLQSEVTAFKGGGVEIGLQENGMGKYVIIRHAGDYSTLYGHLSEICVRDRERVRQGDVIGYVGKTGNARYKGIEPHIHFEIRQGGKHLDPLLFLK